MLRSGAPFFLSPLTFPRAELLTHLFPSRDLLPFLDDHYAYDVSMTIAYSALVLGTCPETLLTIIFPL